MTTMVLVMWAVVVLNVVLTAFLLRALPAGD